MWALSAVGKEARSPICTAMAKGRDAFNPVGKRNTVQELAKRTAIRVPVESYEKQGLPMVLHDSLDKRNKSGEEMGFVHDNCVESHKRLILELIQGLDTAAWNPTAVMRNHVILLAVASVAPVLENEDASSDGLVARDDAQDARGLPRKHGTKNNVKRHLRLPNVILLNG
jgi:hypothetical protein